MQLLLKREDISPNTPDMYGQTPLLWAVFGECHGVVKLLVEYEDVSIDQPDKLSRTPLSLASLYGYKRVVELLAPSRVYGTGYMPSFDFPIPSHMLPTTLADALRLLLSSCLILIPSSRGMRLSCGRRHLSAPEMSSESAEFMPSSLGYLKCFYLLIPFSFFWRFMD